MTRRVRMIVAAGLVLTATACGDGALLLQAALNGGLPLVEALQVPSEHSEGGSEESIRIWYSFTNRTDRTLFLLTGCHDLALDRLEGDEWVTVWPPPGTLCALGEGEVHWLAPGEPFSDIFQIRPPDLLTSGDHRLRLRVFSEGSTRGSFDASPIQLPLRVSAPFPLEVPSAGGSPGG